MSLLSARIGIVGATGVVGRELISILEKRAESPRELRLLASARSRGETILFRSEKLSVMEASEETLAGLDVVFFCASSELSKQLTPRIVELGAVCVDLSSAFRMEDTVPLVVPEVNADAIQTHRGIIANPNCSAIIMLLPLNVLSQRWRARRVVVSTYQAASGAGIEAMRELESQTADVLAGREVVPQAFPYPIAFNLFSHNTPISENGYCGEENKIISETKKILSHKDLDVVPTTIRVPVLRAHSESVTVVFEENPDVEEARQLLSQAPGIRVIDDRASNRFPMPLDVSGQDEVAVGRIRRDTPAGKGLTFFVAGDQIRKGAALNAVQIAELL